jgi:cysteine desulfurase
MLPEIYLDYAATTPVHDAVVDQMLQCLSFRGSFANPASSSHHCGYAAKRLVEQARAQVADVVHADAAEIIWTSGATESNNLALKGIAHAYASRGRHIITSHIEHQSILDSCQALAQHGFEISYLQPEPATGLISPAMLSDALRPDTLLVSLMLVNNELGTRTDVAAMAALCRHNNSFFHVDAAQAVGKIEIDLALLGVDLMSFSAHKCYGPKGIGALYIRQQSGLELQPQMHGGGHEQGLRSGTLATHQIVGMGAAFGLAKQHLWAEQQRLSILRDRLLTGLSALTCYRLNGASQSQLANYLNISFVTRDAEAIIHAIKSVAAVSATSACSAQLSTGSHVLAAIGLSAALSAQTLRISLGYFTSAADIDQVLAAVAALSDREGVVSC